MKHPVILLLATLFFLAGCTKESVTNEDAVKNQSVDSRTSNLVSICHKTGNGQFISIQVNQSAVPAHLAHGDYLPDADGDGYTAVGACSGSMDDCDDTNPNAHPGAAEICDNGIDDDCDGLTDGDDPDCGNPCAITAGVLNSATEYVFYYNAEETKCIDDGFPVVLAVLTDQYIIYTLEFEGLHAYVFATNESECVGVVGDNITEEAYQSVSNMIRALIEAHPEMANLCDDGLRQPNNAQAGLMRSENLVAKMKKAMPERFHKRLGNK